MKNSGVPVFNPAQVVLRAQPASLMATRAVGHRACFVLLGASEHVKSGMFGLAQDHKVLDSVISLDAVEVVDVFRPRECSPERQLNDVAVLKHVAVGARRRMVRDEDEDVSVSRYAVADHATGMATEEAVVLALPYSPRGGGLRGYSSGLSASAFAQHRAMLAGDLS